MKCFLKCFFGLFVLHAAYAQKPVTLRIDPDNAMGGTVSQMFDSVRYVPLETTKESEFGDISALRITDRYFVFKDYDTHSVLMFYKNGKFFKRLQSPGFLAKGFDVDATNGNIGVQYKNASAEKDPVIMTAMAKGDMTMFMSMVGRFVKYALYDSNGNYLRDSIPTSFMSNAFGKDYRIQYGLVPNIEGKDSIGYMINVFKGVDLVYRFAPFNRNILHPPFTRDFEQVMSAGNVNVSNTDSDTLRYCMLPFDYTIYQLAPNAYSAKYKFIFPATYSIPAAYLRDTLFSENAIIDYLVKNKNVVTTVSRFDIRENKLFFDLDYTNINNGRPSHLMYSNTTSNLYNMDKITPDSSNYYLPIPSWLNGTYNEGNFYYSIPAFVMFQVHDGNMERKTNYPDYLQSYFATQNRKTNPFIVELKLKESL